MNTSYNTKTVGCFAAFITGLLTLIIFGVYAVSVVNTQKRLLNQYTSKIEANKTDLANLKSKLPEAASVTTAQMEKLGELFNGYAAARTGKEGEPDHRQTLRRTGRSRP
jgi:predicted PolB exonuclease-like 3'-5' exonuclease